MIITGKGIRMAHKLGFENNAAVIRELEDFDPEAILFCGQAFRWVKEQNLYRGIAHKKVIFMEMQGNTLRLFPVSEKEFYEIWEDYFDLKRDYAILKKAFEKDEILRKGIEYAPGMRVLNQEPFETMISFILSANNNVKRISGIIEKLCARFGDKIEHESGTYYAFPDAKRLANAQTDEILECGAGYRARYVKAAAQAVCDGLDLVALKSKPYGVAKKELQRIPGIGEKVADCILLYSMGFVQAFPMDVWIKRTLFNLYGCCAKNSVELNEYIRARFGSHAGLAQQYLFHYVRKNRLGILETRG